MSFGGNGSEGQSNTHVFSATDHGETSVMSSGRDMGGTNGIISTGSGGNAVGDDLHRENTGNLGTVGFFANGI